ncbi:MAG: DUF2281 domain-containing protein [Fibromonadaceae bacterium]|jgi:hypothetical protein|nr:DUF2281 domain-containing protein [Fibromonadaceae bacterium]
MQVQAYQGSIKRGVFIPFNGVAIPDGDEAILTIIRKSIIPQAQKTKMSMQDALGCMRGQFKMTDDFDAPLDCFKEYVP